MKVEKFQVLMEELEKRDATPTGISGDSFGQSQLVHTLIESRTNVTPTCPKCGHDQIARWSLAVNQHAKIIRKRVKSTLKSYHPKCVNIRHFVGEPWSDNNGSCSRNQAPIFY